MLFERDELDVLISALVEYQSTRANVAAYVAERYGSTMVPAELKEAYVTNCACTAGGLEARMRAALGAPPTAEVDLARLDNVIRQLRATEACAAAVIEAQDCGAVVVARWAARELRRMLSDAKKEDGDG